MRYLIPIASSDDLFPKEEYHFPKPLIEVNGSPMIGLVIESIKNRDPSAKFVFVILKKDSLEYSLDQALYLIAGEDSVIVELENPTLGAVCTALMAVEFINDQNPIVICNGDQIIDDEIGEIVKVFERERYDAGVITFNSVHPRWSYVREDESGHVIETAEKRVLSKKAIAGFYYFSTGELFVDAAKEYLLNSDPINGKYYLSPVLNQIILKGGKVGNWGISTENYISFYSPKRIELFQSEKRKRTILLERKNLQVVIPMAGLGSRFSSVGYSKPKPFIDVKGKTMIERVMDNLRVDDSKFILIARQEHLAKEPEVVYSLTERGDLLFSPIDFVTEGAACTVLTAINKLDPDSPLLIANCDQIVDFDCSEFVADAVSRDLDGSILCFKDDERNPKWSFARTDDAGYVVEVKEKEAISDIATVGLYYFRRAGDFISNATNMILRRDRVNGEYYVCPVYNYLVDKGAKVGVFMVDPKAMHGIGTPEDLDKYLKLI